MPLSRAQGGVDVYFLGEQHDNPEHHARQAELVAEIAPTVIVFEMLRPEQAVGITPDLIGNADALAEHLKWDDSGWPDFGMYHPIFTAAPTAVMIGAGVPRDAARRAMSQGSASAFGPEAGLYGLSEPLPEDQRKAREALQHAAHCEALPPDMLPMMVDVQRFRDATLARAALEALRQYGGPVVVITGNGHARTDWGAPSALRHADPDVLIHALGQGEASFGAPDGTFDSVEIASDVDRGDPCEAFR